MLEFIYYPVSWIMWVWHWLFAHITPDTPGGSGIAWTLSVVFLVFTLRAILYKPFVKQIATTRKMQQINPELQAMRKKYANDRVKMTEEIQKLQKEHGFNPVLGCLPMLLQIPVFIGLFHVLRSFNRMGEGFGQLSMTAEETRANGNYAFSPELVQNFLDARLFGVPLSANITQPEWQWEAFSPDGAVDFTRVQIAIVVVPIMIVASFATHMNSRASVSRQTPEALENPQTRIMNQLALYVFPLGILATGPFFPVAILLYWVSNNLWTYAQQHIVFGRIEREEQEQKDEKAQAIKDLAPKPGAKAVWKNFDPIAQLRNSRQLWESGNHKGARTAGLKVLDYSRTNAWRTDDGEDGLVAAGAWYSEIVDDPAVHSAVLAEVVDAARDAALQSAASEATLERYFTLRGRQVLLWLRPDLGAYDQVIGALSKDDALINRIAEIRMKGNDASDPVVWRTRRMWDEWLALAQFRKSDFDEARPVAEQALKQIGKAKSQPTVESELRVEADEGTMKVIASVAGDNLLRNLRTTGVERKRRRELAHDGAKQLRSVADRAASDKSEDPVTRTRFEAAAEASHGYIENAMKPRDALVQTLFVSSELESARAFALIPEEDRPKSSTDTATPADTTKQSGTAKQTPKKKSGGGGAAGGTRKQNARSQAQANKQRKKGGKRR